MLALCSPTANTAWFVLGPELEENRPPPKAVFKKHLENVHSLSGLGVRCLLDRLAHIAAEDTVVLQQRGREGM